MASFVERQEHQLEIIPPYSIIQCRRADIIEKDGVEVGRAAGTPKREQVLAALAAIH